MSAVLLAVASGALGAAALAYLRPAPLLSLPPLVVPLAAAGASVALALGGTAATGWAPLDLALRTALGALAVLCAARAGDASVGWLALVATAAVAIAVAPVPWLAGAALGAHLALWVAGLSTAQSRAALAAAALGPMAHLEWPLATGVSAGATAIALAPALLVGFSRFPARARRVSAVALCGTAVIAVVGAVGGGAAALGARGEVDRAVGAATEGLDLLGQDDDAARARLVAAAQGFESAESSLRAPWARLALAVPGVAQQSRAAATMASAGADLARTAASASADADLEAVRPRDGKVDLAALAELRDPLARSMSSLRRAAQRLDEVRSPLLVSPLASRLEDLRSRVDGALASAEIAVQAVEVAPALLGAHHPRRYFLAFHNPAELRGVGGFMGNWAEMVVEGGRFELVRTGELRELRTPGVTLEAHGEAEFVARYGELAARNIELLGLSPDFPTVARLLTQLYPQVTGAEIDGVIALTPRSYAALLELTGPIAVPGFPVPLTPENAERVLLHEQYREFPQARAEDREQFLADATELLFDRLMTGELPGPSGIASALGPVVDSRDLFLFSPEPAEQALFVSLGAAGSAVRPEADSFGVVTQNLGGNKIDWFLRRSVSYDIRWDPGRGAVSGTLTVTLLNQAPDRGLPESIIGWGGEEGGGRVPTLNGENRMLVTIYTTFPIRAVTLDGEVVAVERGMELGHHTVRLHLSILSGATRKLRVELAGTVAPGDRYLIQPLRQTTPEPDHIRARVSLPEGWAVEGAEGATATGRRVDAAWRGTDPARLVLDVEPDQARSLLDRLRGVR